MSWEVSGNLPCDLLDDWVLDGGRKRRNSGVGLGKLSVGATVLVVEIPISALWLSFGIEEDISFGAQSSVVSLHQEVLFALGPRGKFGTRNEKLGTGMAVNGNAKLFGEGRKEVKGVVLVGIEEVNLPYLIFLNPVGEDGGVVSSGWGIGEMMIESGELLFL
jgi:hypothetical protein